MKSHIESIIATPVLVPSKPDSIMSEGIVDDWSKSPGIGKTSGGSTQAFPTLTKYILRAKTNAGLVGLGETYRAVELDKLHRNANALIGVPLDDLQLSHLPFDLDREYEGFEIAVYDLVGQQLNVPIHRLLGGKCRDKVYISMWTARRTPEDAGRKAYEGLQKGFDIIKFKCNDQDDVVAWAGQVKKQCGDHMKIIFDPNQRWGNYETAKSIMESLGKYEKNVLLIEDPISRQHLADYKRLRGIGGLQVAVHVALPYCVHGQSAADTLVALAADACDVFNFNGPMSAFVRLAEIALLAGKTCWHGSEVDLGILEASHVHAAAAAPACTVPSDIFGRLVREHDLLTEPLKIANAYVDVPTSPGLGVKLDEGALEKYRSGEDISLGS